MTPPIALAEWRAAGLEAAPVGVNVSARQCLNRGIVEVVREALRLSQLGISATYVTDRDASKNESEKPGNHGEGRGPAGEGGGGLHGSVFSGVARLAHRDAVGELHPVDLLAGRVAQDGIKHII